MKKAIGKILVIFTFFTFYSCGEKNDNGLKTVEIKKSGNKFTLYRNGEPYYIKGAGGYTHFEKIKECGGNSIRVWGTDNALFILDEAHKLGMTVTLGLNVASERQGFDYNNEEEVAKQLERLREDVLTYKDHPALLMWGVGNELDIMTAESRASNIKVWDAVNDIARMIHETDPNHPTTTMIVPFRRTIRTIKTKCPEIDILSINTFGELIKLPEKLREFFWGWPGAYVVTEWGPQGWWEAYKTAWDVAIEETSTRKAELYRERYESAIKRDEEKCIGSYVFYWGQKQERTSTWFSMFLETGEDTEPVDVMQYLWTGKYPSNRAPQIERIILNEKEAKENIFINASKNYKARVFADDPDKDKIFYKWEIRPEITEDNISGGGDYEFAPDPIPDLIINNELEEVIFTAPTAEGPYRLFVYVLDGKNKGATANIPFFVIP